MQAIVLARSDQWAELEEFLLIEWDLVFTDVLQARPVVGWSDAVETHRLGRMIVRTGDTDKLKASLEKRKAQVIILSNTDPMMPYIDTMAGERSLALNLGV